MVSSVIEEDLGVGKPLEVSGDGGIVATLDGGCWRIRLSPEMPMPCSCSETMGDLSMFSCSFGLPESAENRMRPVDCACFASTSRFPVLRFFGIEREEPEGGGGDLEVPADLGSPT
jgi:hypothetical protein